MTYLAPHFQFKDTRIFINLHLAFFHLVKGSIKICILQFSVVLFYFCPSFSITWLGRLVPSFLPLSLTCCVNLLTSFRSKQALQGSQQGRATKLLNMSRQQLSFVDLPTGHLGLYGHLHRIGKDINPLCRRCLNGNETVEHLLCECESLTMSRGSHVWTKFRRASTTLPCPCGSISTVCHGNRTN